MHSKQTKKYCALDQEGQEMIRTTIENLHFSARAYDRILKVARTIADLAESETIHADHVAEAIQYRSLDKMKN
jgi:magnesium chelatase family protein